MGKKDLLGGICWTECTPSHTHILIRIVRIRCATSVPASTYTHHRGKRIARDVRTYNARDGRRCGRKRTITIRRERESRGFGRAAAHMCALPTTTTIYYYCAAREL